MIHNMQTWMVELDASIVEYERRHPGKNMLRAMSHEDLRQIVMHYKTLVGSVQLLQAEVDGLRIMNRTLDQDLTFCEGERDRLTREQGDPRCVGDRGV